MVRYYVNTYLSSKKVSVPVKVSLPEMLCYLKKTTYAGK